MKMFGQFLNLISWIVYVSVLSYQGQSTAVKSSYFTVFVCLNVIGHVMEPLLIFFCVNCFINFSFLYHAGHRAGDCRFNFSINFFNVYVTGEVIRNLVLNLTGQVMEPWLIYYFLFINVRAQVIVNCFNYFCIFYHAGHRAGDCKFNFSVTCLMCTSPGRWL